MLSQAKLEYDATKKLYSGTALYEKAPNGKKSNLTEEQWVLVRTPAFKKWFGDWEAKIYWDILNNEKPISMHPESVSREEAKNIYEQIKTSNPNKYDGVSEYSAIIPTV